MHKPAGAPGYDVERMQADMADLGWMQIDLARAAALSHMTVGRFLRGERQTARTAKKLAVALGYSVRRYLVSPSGSTQERDSERQLQGGAR